MFLLGSQLGDETFYALFFAFWFWNIGRNRRILEVEIEEYRDGIEEYRDGIEEYRGWNTNRCWTRENVASHCFLFETNEL